MEKEKTQITVLTDGPVKVEGLMNITYNGVDKEDSVIYLCRCGVSKHKPYCDGSHRAVNFKD